MTGWVGKALFHGLSPFVDPHLNYPGELLLAATDAPFLSMFLVSPVSYLANPTFAYNLIILLSHILSGFFTYLWMVRITNNRYAGIAAGLIFELSPYRITHSYGHLQMVSTQFIPIFFWSLDNAIQKGLLSLQRYVVLGVSVFLLGMGGAQYYLVICLLAGACYVLFSAPGVIPGDTLGIRFLARYGWKLISSVAVGALLSSLPYLTAYAKTTYTHFQVEETRMWSASLLDFFVPSRLHLLWGGLVQELYPRSTWIEHTLYLGIAASLLALVGILLRSSKYQRKQFSWLCVIFFGLLIALGTDLHYNGSPMQTHPLWLPAYYIAHLPIFNLMRVWARYTIIPIFFIAMLAGVGLSLISQRLQQLPSSGKGNTMHACIMVLCLSVILLDFAPGRPEISSLNLRPVDQWLVKQPDPFAVAFLPPGAENYRAMYGSLFHEKYLPAWNHPTHLPQEYKQFLYIAEDFPSTTSLLALQNMGFLYLILHKPSFDGVNNPSWQEVEKVIVSTPVLHEELELQNFLIVRWENNGQ
jgi:hypothetical protein